MARRRFSLSIDIEKCRRYACDLRATYAEDRKIAGGNLSPIRRNMLLFTGIAFARTNRDRCGVALLPAPQKEPQEYLRMKALISAFALLAFVGASTVPYVAHAQGSTPPRRAPRPPRRRRPRRAGGEEDHQEEDHQEGVYQEDVEAQHQLGAEDHVISPSIGEEKPPEPVLRGLFSCLAPVQAQGMPRLAAKEFSSRYRRRPLWSASAMGRHRYRHPGWRLAGPQRRRKPGPLRS